MIVKIQIEGTGESIAVLVEDQVSVPSPQMVAHSHP